MNVYNHIIINPGWNTISIPMIYGHWDSDIHDFIDDGLTPSTIKNVVCDQIEDTLGVQCSSVISIFKTYDNIQNKWFAYFPNITNENNENNFLLHVIDDEDKVEYRVIALYSTSDNDIEIIHLDPHLDWIDGGTFS